MEYFIVALMTLVDPVFGTQNVYVFTKPHATIQECKMYAVANIPQISETLYKNFGPDDKPSMITCVTKKTIKEFAIPAEEPTGENIHFNK